MGTAVTLLAFAIFVCLDRAQLMDVRSLVSKHNAHLMIASVVYVDLLSGLLHITLDNPTLNHWPILGPACEAFQGHHASPNDITRIPWTTHLSEFHSINA